MQPGMEGLYLTEPGADSLLLRGSTRIVQQVSQSAGLAPFVGDADALAQGRYITLTPFTSHLHGGLLSRDLERWAPQLFAPEAAS